MKSPEDFRRQLRLFYAYSHKDKSLRDELEVCLSERSIWQMRRLANSKVCRAMADPSSAGLTVMRPGETLRKGSGWRRWSYNMQIARSLAAPPAARAFCCAPTIGTTGGTPAELRIRGLLRWRIVLILQRHAVLKCGFGRGTSRSV
jgi:hypothetical protein